MDGSGPKDIRSPIQSEPKTPLSPAQIAFRQYFRESFRFTQGSFTNQKVVTSWVVASGLMPDVELPRRMPSYLKTVAPPGAHLQRSSEERKDDLDFAYREVVRITKDGAKATPEYLAGNILGGMLQMELKYQLRGRYGRRPNDDMFDSYMRRYLILGEATGSPILDKLALELRRKLDELRKKPREVIDPTEKSKKIAEITRLLRGNFVQEQDAISLMRQLGQRELLALIEEYWELNHSGKKFYPEEALSTAE